MFVIIIFIIQCINSAQTGIDYLIIMKHLLSRCSSEGQFCSLKKPGLKFTVLRVEDFTCDP